VKYPKVPQICVTVDYNAFKIISFNRQINPRNLSRIVTQAQKDFKLHLFPIIVNENMEIIDGQHRFTACKTHGWPVYYIKMPGKSATVEEVYSLNIVGKKHTLSDKIQMLYLAGDAEISKAFVLADRFPKVAASDIVMLCVSHQSSGKTLDSVNRGEYKVTRFREAGELLLALEASTLPERFTNRTIFAVATLCVHNNIKPSQLMSQIEKYKHLVKPYKTKDDVRRNYADVYNYRRHSNSHISGSKKGAK